MNSSDKPPAVGGELQPEEIHSNPSLTSQINYLMSGDIDSDPVLNSGSVISGPNMSISPIAKSGKPKAKIADTASYPSQQLNSRFKTEPIPDEEKFPSSPQYFDCGHYDPPQISTADAKLPPPPLPPPVVHSPDFPFAASLKQSVTLRDSPVDSSNGTNQDGRAKDLDGFVIGLSTPAREAVTALQSFKSGVDTTHETFKSGVDTTHEKKSGMEVASILARTIPTNPIAAATASAAKPRTSSRTKKEGNRKEATGVGIEKPGKNDILRGRGGYTNHHPGNIKFRNAARALRADYRRTETGRSQKYLISVELVRNVKAYGGRFLEKGKNNLWYEMDEKAARKKASQVLREEKWD